jgi:excisionase family DNA binding protein
MNASLTNVDGDAGAGDDKTRNATRPMPVLLTVNDVAVLLRTTKRAVYAMIERRQLPGLVRIGRRVLLRADALLHWLDQKSAPSPGSER